MSARRVDVTVIVPVYNDSVRLEACLQALARQTFPREAAQFVVVDNASTEDIRAVVARHPWAEYAHEPVKGPAAARNRGVSVARGAVLAFTDADCLPDESWLANGVRRVVAAPGLGLLGGRVDIFYRDPARPTVAELYDSVTYLDQKAHVEEAHYAATANMFTTRAVWDAVGGFDTSFPLASGEDDEWGIRVHERGYPQLYADDVRVRHPAELTFRGLVAKAARLERGMVQLYAVRPSTAPRSSVLRVFAPLLNPARLCARLARHERVRTFADRATVCAVAVFLYYYKLGVRLQGSL